MKTILMKIFLMVAAMACMMQGMLLLSVGFGKLSPEKLINLYVQLLNSPAAFRTIQISGAFFILLGFILLILASRTKQLPKMITVVQEGQSLTITYRTVIDFIEQVGSQDPFVTHFSADFIYDPKEGIIIPIEIELNGVPSVHNVLVEMENTLRGEIENVFGLKKIRFDFHVEGVSIDPKKKYFTSHGPQKEQVVEPTVVQEASQVISQTAPQEVLQTVPPDLAQTVHHTAVPTAVHATAQSVVHEVSSQSGERLTVTKYKKPVLKIEPELEESFSEKRSDEEIEQLFETNKKDLKKPSLVARMLWGK